MRASKKKSHLKEVLQANSRLFELFRFSVFLFVFLSVIFIIYDLLDLSAIQRIEANIISWVFDAHVYNMMISLPTLNVSITKECSGFKTFAFLISLILSTPYITLRRKMVLSLLSPLIAFVLNILRISLSIWLSIHTKADLYYYYDTYLLGILNSIIILVVWYFTALIYVEKFEKRKVNN